MKKGELAAPSWVDKCVERYGFHPLEEDLTGEDILFRVADNKCQGCPEDAARKILQDFRTGRMGSICLQLAPEKVTDHGQAPVGLNRNDMTDRSAEFEKDRIVRAQVAIETAKQQGLELPPVLEEKQEQNVPTMDTQEEISDGGKNKKEDSIDVVGKGLFDGW